MRDTLSYTRHRYRLHIYSNSNNSTKYSNTILPTYYINTQSQQHNKKLATTIKKGIDQEGLTFDHLLVYKDNIHYNLKSYKTYNLTRIFS